MDQSNKTDLPFIKLYTGDYRRLTVGLSLSEKGALMELVLYFWDTGQHIPDDDKKITAILGCSLNEWQRIRPNLLNFCFEACDGVLRQRYFENHREDSADLRKRNVERARRAANTRHLKAVT